MEGISIKQTKKRTRDDALITPTQETRASSLEEEGEGGDKQQQASVAKTPAEWGGVDRKQPTVSLMAQLDGIATLRILGHHIDWLQQISNRLTRSPSENEGIDGSSSSSGSSIHIDSEPAFDSLFLVSRCSWIYSLLANLVKPLHRDTECDITRLYQTSMELYQFLELSKKTTDAAKEACESSEALKALAVVISISGRYFNQAPYEMR
jgi:hypothetical protein